MKKLLFISLIFLFACCKNDDVDPNTTTYTVPAGDHYSTFDLTLLGNSVLEFSFTTDSSWIWPEPEHNGYSKVCGIAWNSNHSNSVRIVYMRSNDIGVLGYYYYLNGVSPMENDSLWGVMDTVEIGKTYYCRLGWENEFYFIRMGDKNHSHKVPEKPNGWTNLQHPYIGGTYTIDHDWKTTVKWR